MGKGRNEAAEKAPEEVAAGGEHTRKVRKPRTPKPAPNADLIRRMAERMINDLVSWGGSRRSDPFGVGVDEIDLAALSQKGVGMADLIIAFRDADALQKAGALVDARNSETGEFIGWDLADSGA